MQRLVHSNMSGERRPSCNTGLLAVYVAVLFYCLLTNNATVIHIIKNSMFLLLLFFRCVHDIHLWGRVFNIENLGLYGSACIKAPHEPSGCQEISFLIDSKVAGVQLEVSACAAEALSSVLVTLMPDTDDSRTDDYYRPTYTRQVGLNVL